MSTLKKEVFILWCWKLATTLLGHETMIWSEEFFNFVNLGGQMLKTAFCPYPLLVSHMEISSDQITDN